MGLSEGFLPFNHIYSVSENGELLKNGLPFAPIRRKDGYLYFASRTLLHRAVASLWIRPLENGEHVHHINEDKSDNRACNLEIVQGTDHIRNKHPDVIKKLSGSKLTESGRQKLREFRLGTKMSEETKRKIGEKMKLLGIKPPPSTKWSEHRKLLAIQNPVLKTQCSINGITYRSLRDAERKTGIKWGTIRKRCLSENFPEYRLLSIS